MSENEIEQRVTRKLEFVGLEEATDQLAGRTLRRDEAACGDPRAVVDDHDIALFDEPTAGLDPPTARTIYELALNCATCGASVPSGSCIVLRTYAFSRPVSSSQRRAAGGG